MGALDKFKNLFGEKGPTPKSKKANHLKEASKNESQKVKADQKGSTSSHRDKAEVEILQRKIQERLRKDPQLQRKAAMIVENMINKKPSPKNNKK